MLDFILKPGRQLEYQDNALLLKFKGNLSVVTCRKLNRIGNSSVSKGFDQLERTSANHHAPVILRA